MLHAIKFWLNFFTQTCLPQSYKTVGLKSGARKRYSADKRPCAYYFCGQIQNAFDFGCQINILFKVLFPLLKVQLEKLHSVFQSSAEVQFNEFPSTESQKLNVTLEVFNLCPGNNLHAWGNSIKIQQEFRKLTQGQANIIIPPLFFYPTSMYLQCPQHLTYFVSCIFKSYPEKEQSFKYNYTGHSIFFFLFKYGLKEPVGDQNQKDGFLNKIRVCQLSNPCPIPIKSRNKLVNQ